METLTPEQLKAARVIFARQNGLKGGAARASALTPERRREIARLGGLTKARNHPKVVKPKGKPGRPLGSKNRPKIQGTKK